ncbi:MAG: helix-turn-helix domain-containing protein, partial [Burkholderiales bacterium]
RATAAAFLTFSFVCEALQRISRIGISINSIYSRRSMRGRSESHKRKLRELLRELREAAGLRQVDLADRLKRPQSFISKYEAGEKTLNFLELKEVCQALGVSMVDFVRRFDENGDET